MSTLLGIFIGALVIGFIWMVIYFNQEISKLRAESRQCVSNDVRNYHTTYRELTLEKQLDDCRKALKYYQYKDQFEDAQLKAEAGAAYEDLDDLEFK